MTRLIHGSEEFYEMALPFDGDDYGLLFDFRLWWDVKQSQASGSGYRYRDG